MFSFNFEIWTKNTHSFQMRTLYSIVICNMFSVYIVIKKILKNILKKIKPYSMQPGQQIKAANVRCPIVFPSLLFSNPV